MWVWELITSHVLKLRVLPAREKRGCGRSGPMCLTEWLPPKTACRLQSVSTWLRRDAVAFRSRVLRHRSSFRTHRLDMTRSWLVFQRCFWSLGSQWEHARRCLLPVYRQAWKNVGSDRWWMLFTGRESWVLLMYNTLCMETMLHYLHHLATSFFRQ